MNSISVCEEENVEFITVELPGVVVHSLYKPPPEPFLPPPLGHRIKPHIVIGDFNSHSNLWGYTTTDSDGEAVENKIPKIWRQSKIIATLEPGKDSAIPKNYRPISILCHTYNLYERLILNRVSQLLEQYLIKEQAGFLPGKSCTSQLLNLTQHIEDGYQRDMITGAAYDTVTHRILIQKHYSTTQDSQLCKVFQNMLSNRRFYVEPNNQRSIWRKQKNGLPQRSVLSPIMFNIYTNDQPIHDGTRNFIYADELCVTAQYSSFTEVETTIGDALEELTQYYRSNSLHANPDKTQVTAFHLRNK